MADELYRRLGCAVCALPVPEAKRRPRKYCTAKCKSAAADRLAGKRPLAEYRAAVRNPANYFDCERCGKPSHRPLSGSNKSLNRWCSMACRLAHGEALREPRFSAYYAGTCADCGIAAARSRQWSQCDPCKGVAVRAAMREAAVALHKAAAKVVQCQECKADYCPVYGCQGSNSICAPCSEVRVRRGMKASRLKRKAKQRGATVENVNPWRVFERDGWCCYLCGCHTPSDLRGTLEPNAPELEHVVPLSKGGAHSYANTKCSCRRCNQAKSDRLPDETPPGGVLGLQGQLL